MADPLTIGLMVGSTLLTAVGQMSAASGENARAKSQAQQLENAAVQERAAGQRNAAEERRQSRIVQSNAIASAAASGGGASDPTATNIISNIAGEGEYRALSRMFEGEQAAVNNINQANATRYEGKQAIKAGRIGAATSILSGASSMYSKYSPAAASTRSYSSSVSSGIARGTSYSHKPLRTTGAY